MITPAALTINPVAGPRTAARAASDMWLELDVVAAFFGVVWQFGHQTLSIRCLKIFFVCFVTALARSARFFEFSHFLQQPRRVGRSKPNRFLLRSTLQ